MSQAYGSKQAAATLIDPLNEPEPSAETGPGASFGSTFAPASQTNGSASPTSSSNNPYRAGSIKQPAPTGPAQSKSKGGATSTVRSSSGSPREKFPDYRANAFADYEASNSRRRAASASHNNGRGATPPSYQEATSSNNLNDGAPRRRGSSLRERYPGDTSHQPLNVIRRDSKKAYRSPHLHKSKLPGADMIDRLDPAIGGIAYHHEGPYDAALMSRNRDTKTAPLGALEDSNREALKATPAENIKDAVERHQPLDGVAVVPPEVPDRFGRRLHYEEGADLMHEASSGDPGYKRWAGKDYDPSDLKGESEPTYSLDRALQAHKISENNGAMEMEDRTHLMEDYRRAEQKGTLDQRDPVEIAGDDGKYADLEIAAAESSARRSEEGGRRSSGTGVGGSLRKRIGSLRHRHKED